MGTPPAQNNSERNSLRSKGAAGRKLGRQGCALLATGSAAGAGAYTTSNVAAQAAIAIFRPNGDTQAHRSRSKRLFCPFRSFRTLSIRSASSAWPASSWTTVRLREQLDALAPGESRERPSPQTAGEGPFPGGGRPPQHHSTTVRESSRHSYRAGRSSTTAQLRRTSAYGRQWTPRMAPALVPAMYPDSVPVLCRCPEWRLGLCQPVPGGSRRHAKAIFDEEPHFRAESPQNANFGRF